MNIFFESIDALIERGLELREVVGNSHPSRGIALFYNKSAFSDWESTTDNLLLDLNSDLLEVLYPELNLLRSLLMRDLFLGKILGLYYHPEAGEWLTSTAVSEEVRNNRRIQMMEGRCPL